MVRKKCYSDCGSQDRPPLEKFHNMLRSQDDKLVPILLCQCEQRTNTVLLPCFTLNFLSNRIARLVASHCDDNLDR